MNDSRLRLNTRLPPILWRALRRLAAGWGITHDQAIRKLIGDAGGVAAIPHENGRDSFGDALDAPQPTISHDTRLDPHQPIRRS